MRQVNRNGRSKEWRVLILLLGMISAIIMSSVLYVKLDSNSRDSYANNRLLIYNYARELCRRSGDDIDLPSENFDDRIISIISECHDSIVIMGVFQIVANHDMMTIAIEKEMMRYAKMDGDGSMEGAIASLFSLSRANNHESVDWIFRQVLNPNIRYWRHIALKAAVNNRHMLNNTQIDKIIDTYTFTNFRDQEEGLLKLLEDENNKRAGCHL